MANASKEGQFPIWMPESLPQEMVVENFYELLNAQAEEEPTPNPEEPNFGFIVRDWFGPYLLSPPTRFLKGQC